MVGVQEPKSWVWAGAPEYTGEEPVLKSWASAGELVCMGVGEEEHESTTGRAWSSFRSEVAVG
jgi:hypothetical protein